MSNRERPNARRKVQSCTPNAKTHHSNPLRQEMKLFRKKSKSIQARTAPIVTRAKSVDNRVVALNSNTNNNIRSTHDLFSLKAANPAPPPTLSAQNERTPVK